MGVTSVGLFGRWMEIFADYKVEATGVQIKHEHTIIWTCYMPMSLRDRDVAYQWRGGIWDNHNPWVASLTLKLI
jgi:hypothetical protein